MEINLLFIVPTHALHYTLKNLKFAPTCFGLLWNHPHGVHGRTWLRYWIGMLIYICYKECLYVDVCQFIPCVCVCVCVGTYLVDTMSWNLSVLVWEFSVLKCGELYELEQ
jgi:hypothetical protein